MTASKKEQLQAAIGPRAVYYLRRFELIDMGGRGGWNWPAFFLSTAWFTYRGMGNHAGLNFIAPWAAIILSMIAGAVSPYLALAIMTAYMVLAYYVVPTYANALYYRRIKREIARLSTPGKEPSPPTRPGSAAVAGTVTIFIPTILFVVAQGAYIDHTPRSQVSEAISLMSGAKLPAAEHYADKHKWPDDLKQVAGNTSGKYTDRVEITTGAGAASGILTITATMKSTGVHSSVAGKTVQLSTEDGKAWACRRGAVNGVDDKYLPAACRQ